MCLLGLWGGEVEEIGNILGRIFLTNVLIFADKSGAYHSSPKFSYPQVDSASWCWPRQDVSMSIGHRWDVRSLCCPNRLGLCLLPGMDRVWTRNSLLIFVGFFFQIKAFFLCLAYRVLCSPHTVFSFWKVNIWQYYWIVSEVLTTWKIKGCVVSGWSAAFHPHEYSVRHLRNTSSVTGRDCRFRWSRRKWGMSVIVYYLSEF